MRRKDRELSQNEAYDIIDNCQYGVISYINDDEIFSVPISIVRKEDKIYIHGAKGGNKAKLFKDGKDVELVCVIDVKVPEFSNECVKQMIQDNKAANVFTTQYKSAIAKTKAYLINDDETKIKALRLLSEKYTPKYMDAFDVAITQSLKITNVYELKIISVSAKAKILKG
ncbi:pyridoxamine 5'-phosphate oxidase family protein [Campylobacter sp. RM9328]|uniref:pyridoxamine 5'-phosphate oxidase family protein n=1 Tax=Campylobacter sp. RM9328 TaxID=1705720 RepID=UPI00147284AF|nr:pyridoxamine 5'-phosphate oxidase family protein [Campylobacter sp. RM9328]